MNSDYRSNGTDESLPDSLAGSTLTTVDDDQTLTATITTNDKRDDELDGERTTMVSIDLDLPLTVLNNLPPMVPTTPLLAAPDIPVRGRGVPAVASCADLTGRANSQKRRYKRSPKQTKFVEMYAHSKASLEDLLKLNSERQDNQDTTEDNCWMAFAWCRNLFHWCWPRAELNQLSQLND